jgi:Zn-dependent protease
VIHGLHGALLILALFLCVVLHEFGHALTAKYFGISTGDITLYPIGGVSTLEGMPEKAGQELLVAIAGPAVNLVIALVLWLALTAVGQTFDVNSVVESNDPGRIPFLWVLFYVNLILPIFNLIPAFPMDGGRALRSILSFFMSRVRATFVAAQIGQVLAVLFVLVGFFYNFWLIFIGLFVFLGARAEAFREQTKAAFAGLTVKDALITKFTPLRPDTSLGTAADVLLNTQETSFIVVDSERPVGVLGVNEIVRGLTERGSESQASEFMKTDFRIVAPNVRLDDLLDQMLANGQALAVVADASGLIGLIDWQNLQEKIMIERALASDRISAASPESETR